MLSIRSLLSSTLHRLASWPRPLRYKLCDDGCDEEHDNESKRDDDDEPTKDELIDMLKDAKEHFDIKRREYKDLCKELKALKQAFNELNASHERLEEAHEKLGKAHKKLEKAHSTLVEQNEKVVVTCDIGLTCDIIDESFYKPIIVAPIKAPFDWSEVWLVRLLFQLE